jgi:hypothetical protein
MKVCAYCKFYQAAFEGKDAKCYSNSYYVTDPITGARLNRGRVSCSSKNRNGCCPEYRDRNGNNIPVKNHFTLNDIFTCVGVLTVIFFVVKYIF